MQNERRKDSPPESVPKDEALAWHIVDAHRRIARFQIKESAEAEASGEMGRLRDLSYWSARWAHELLVMARDTEPDPDLGQVAVAYLWEWLRTAERVFRVHKATLEEHCGGLVKLERVVEISAVGVVTSWARMILETVYKALCMSTASENWEDEEPDAKHNEPLGYAALERYEEFGDVCNRVIAEGDWQDGLKGLADFKVPSDHEMNELLAKVALEINRSAQEQGKAARQADRQAPGAAATKNDKDAGNKAATADNEPLMHGMTLRRIAEKLTNLRSDSESLVKKWRARRDRKNFPKPLKRAGKGATSAYLYDPLRVLRHAQERNDLEPDLDIGALTRELKSITTPPPP